MHLILSTRRDNLRTLSGLLLTNDRRKGFLFKLNVNSFFRYFVNKQHIVRSVIINIRRHYRRHIVVASNRDRLVLGRDLRFNRFLV